MTKSQEHKLAFFRQSGWLVIATTLGGVFMYAVHMLANPSSIGSAEYGVFTCLLQVLNLMGIPASGLQTVFVQQTAAAVTDEQRRNLAASLKGVLTGTFVFWCLCALGVVVFQNALARTLQLPGVAPLWITLFLGLFALWQPIAWGVLQGRQDFTWYGISTFLNGFTRFSMVALLVLVLHGKANSALIAALLGLVVTVGVAGWKGREAWLAPGGTFEWRRWLNRVVPLTCGSGATIFMMSADMIFVQSLFPKDTTGGYGAVGMIGRALLFFTVPMTTVMFPKIVQSAARSQDTRVVAQALQATAFLGGCAALFCTVLPWFPLWLVYGNKPMENGESILKMAYLVPWFAWSILPLTLATVLIGNLMARERYEVVPSLMLVAAGYGAALTWFNSSFIQVVQTLGVFGLLLLGVSIWFTWRMNKTTPRLNTAKALG